ncbi:MAG: AMP-binding protein, partial [Bacteroidota bacterium]
ESENPYFQKVISFVNLWKSGAETIQIKTSGSTGIPKVIDIKRGQMVASAKMTAQIFGLKEGSHLFCCLNVDFIAGMMMMVRAMELKAQVTVIEPVNNPFLNIHSDKKYDFAAFVPMQMEAILENDQSKKYLNKTSGLQNIIIGGAAVNENISTKIESIAIPCFATYGMTETVSHVAIRPLNGENKSPYFQKLNEIDFEIDDRNCLKIKGDCTDNQWVQTNDIVEMINSHSFKLLGRADRVINSGGIKIFLDRVEKDIETVVHEYFHNNVRYFLFGIADQKLGEKLAIVIEAENPNFLTNCKDIFKNSTLSRYSLPKEVFFMPTFIPTESGKIDYKNTIKQLLN